MSENNLEFSRSLYEKTIDWYKNADAKAQIILTLNGAFIAFLTSSIFKNPEDLSKITNKFNGLTWLFLALMCVCILGSIGVAIKCLWSRISTSARRADSENTGESLLNEIAFFGTIRLLDPKVFQSQLLKMKEDFEIEALATQIHLLSKNVYKKHLAVNFGFVLAGGALIFFLFGGISYLLNVR